MNGIDAATHTHTHTRDQNKWFESWIIFDNNKPQQQISATCVIKVFGCKLKNFAFHPDVTALNVRLVVHENEELIYATEEMKRNKSFANPSYIHANDVGKSDE